jgi:hypothetical protein
MLDRDRQRFQLHALLREELRNLAPLGELPGGSCHDLGEAVCRLGSALARMPRVLDRPSWYLWKPFSSSVHKRNRNGCDLTDLDSAINP